MLIEEYIKENEDFDILGECELEFANPEDSQEAKENIQWVLDNECSLEALSVVVCSYYGGTIDWSRM